MIILQMIICLTIPVLMWYFGSTRRNGRVAYLKKGISYRIGRAKASKEAWTFANDVFFNMLRMSGINIALISLVLLFLVNWKYSEQLWVLSVSLLVMELCTGLLLPSFVTNAIVKKTFDENGVLFSSQDEEEDLSNLEEESGQDETGPEELQSMDVSEE